MMKDERIQINFLLNSILLIVPLLLFFAFPKHAFASTLSLSPGSGTVGVGGTLAVQVRLNTQGEQINGVSAYLSYPANMLDVTYVTGGSAFGIEAEKSFGGGSIKISRGSITPVSATVTVATIGFRGKSQGTATVSFAGGSAAPRASDSTDSLNLGGSTGGSYTVSGQASPPSKTTPPSSTEDTKGPIITNLTVSEVSTTDATITWNTDEPADATIEYGLDEGKYFLSASISEPKTNHSLTLSSPLFVSGAIVHFRVIATDAKGNVTSSNNMLFHLKGYQLTLTVVDTNNKPVAEKEVLFYTNDPQRGITDTQGKVVFKDVTAGKHLVVVKLNDSLSQTFEITVADTPMEQQSSVSIEGLPKGGNEELYIVLMVLVVSFVGLIGTLSYIKKRKQSFH